MHPFKKMILSMVFEPVISPPPTGNMVSLLNANSYFDSDSGNYYINVNLQLTTSVLVDTVIEVQVDGGMLSTITLLAGNNIGSDNLDTGSSSLGAGPISACILSCDNLNVNYASVACPI